MAEKNLIKTPDLGAVNAIDFVNVFGGKIDKLRELLGVTRPFPLKQGNIVRTYNFNVDLAEGDGIVPEGDDIPLSHVSRVPGEDITVDFRKYRRAVSIEEVHRVGYETASNKVDRALLAEIQKEIRKGFITNLDKNPTDLGTATDLQDAFAKAWGNVEDVFDGEADETVVFINPLDAGNYLGSAVIENGQSVGFGLTLLSNFTNVRVFINNSVPKGTVYATAANNLNLAYIDGNGETSRMFHGKNVYKDDLGLINYVKDDNTTNLTEQASIYLGITLFAEVLNGVFKLSLGE